jgi:hypothetical protein
MAHTLKHPELPPVVMFSPDGSSNVSRETIDAFMAHQVARRKRGATCSPSPESGLGQLRSCTNWHHHLAVDDG